MVESVTITLLNEGDIRLNELQRTRDTDQETTEETETNPDKAFAIFVLFTLAFICAIGITLALKSKFKW